jgi:hypothetical protein
MNRAFRWAWWLTAGLLLLATPAHGQVTVPESLATYALTAPPSEFQWGCFAPCMCPVLVRAPLSGTFALVRRSGGGIGAVAATWDVRDVRWSVPNGATTSVITGAGTYTRTGTATATQQLVLDLAFDGSPPQQFDSGTVPAIAPFPEIAAHVSLHGEYCHDSVLVVDARPVAVAGLPRGALAGSLLVAPNPFAGSARLTVELPHEARVRLAVYDVSGRAVRVLEAGDTPASGGFTRTWDGRRDDGATTPPGLYLVRLDSPSGRLTIPAVKLR